MLETRMRAWTVPQPSIFAACSISEEMEVKVPRNSQMAKAWLKAALSRTSPMQKFYLQMLENQV